MRDKTIPKWRLHALLQDPEQDLAKQTKTLEQHIRQLERQRPRLCPTLSTDQFRSVFQREETISALIAKLRASAFLWFAENTKNQAARAFEAKVRERLSSFHSRALFLDLWWQSLDDKHIRRLLPHSGDLQYYLESLRRVRHHTLSEPEERIITIKNSTGRQAVESLYGVLTNGLTFRLKVKKRIQDLTREELMTYVRSHSPQLREIAYQELLRVYATHQDLIGEMYKTLVMDWKHDGVALRHYPNPIAVRNVANDIPNEAVETLLTVCRRNVKLFQHYFRLKARLLGRKSLTRYHIYAPINSSSVAYSFTKAVSLVMNAYKQFSPTLAELAQRVLTEEHLHARVSPGKMGGAFCYSVLPSLTPYVLLNYTGQSRDVATLAHELGHAVHSMLAKDHSVLTFHPCLPLAETASVFGEQLLAEAFLCDVSHKQARRALLVTQLDDYYATIIRQAYFVEFERQAHQMIHEGATVEQLSQRYLQLLREQFGRAVMVPQEFRWEWLMIPHIFASPFYCYAYSFGNLLVLALYQQFKREGSPFIPKYLELLAKGGAASPDSILRTVGADMRSKALWQSGFDQIQEMVVALEQSMP